MNWQMRTAIGAAFALEIIVVVYFKGALWQILTASISNLWQILAANADAITAIAAVLAAIAGTVAGGITLLVYRSNKKANNYRYFADLYYEILRRGLDHPEFLDPKKTRKYKEVFNRKKRIQYNNYARMCWAHAFDIYDVSDFKDYFIRLYSPTFERYNGLHGVWLLDNTSTFSLDFIEFVKLNGWRDYLDERKADRLRWSNVVEDYDEKILNPFLPEVINPLFDYIAKDLKEVKYKVVADFGCGNGKLVEILAKEEKFEKVYGIDYSDNMLKMAEKRCKNLQNVTYRKMDMTKLEEEMEKLGEEIYGKIDIAFSINSILPRNHKDTPIILHEIYNALKPGGLFIAILPSFDTVLYLKKLWYKRRTKHLKERYKYNIKKLRWICEARMDTWRKFHKHLKLNKHKHLYADDGSNVQRFIHEKEIKRLLKKAGFEILKKRESYISLGIMQEL